MIEADVIAALYEALRDAKEHLEYCGYGDEWERECAKESKLAERIEAALALVNDQPISEHMEAK